MNSFSTTSKNISMVRKEWKLLLVKATIVKIQNIDKSLQRHTPDHPRRSFLVPGLAGDADVNHYYPILEIIQGHLIKDSNTITILNVYIVDTARNDGCNIVDFLKRVSCHRVRLGELKSRILSHKL